MPRAPSEKITKAEQLFNDGIPMVEIAQKLGVPDGTVRSWKNRYSWGKTSKKNNCNVAKEDNSKIATLQKKKRGGQPGNKNSKGASKGKGNPHPNPPPDRTKHGGYIPVFMDALDEDEQKLVEAVPDDEEQLLLEQIQLFSIRERRIMQAINKYRNTDSPVAVSFTNRSERKRAFESEEEEKEYNRIVAEKVANGERMPGREYSTFTQTDNKDQIIARLESELSNVQSKKTKAIEALSKIRFERRKIENESVGNAAVDDWIAAVLGEDVNADE